jgi:hypothetical protein
VFVEVFEEGLDFVGEVGDLVFEGEEGFADGLESVGLDEWPFLNDFGVFIFGEEDGNFIELLGHGVELCDFEEIELLFILVLFGSGSEDCAVWDGVDEILEVVVGVRGADDGAFFGGEEDYHLGVGGVEVFVDGDGFSREAEKEPIE